MVKYTEIDNQYIIRQALLDDTIVLEFVKADGTVRKMNATLQESVVPHVEANTERKTNPDIQVVWDTTANGWRSFRWDRLQGIHEYTE